MAFAIPSFYPFLNPLPDPVERKLAAGDIMGQFIDPSSIDLSLDNIHGLDALKQFVGPSKNVIGHGNQILALFSNQMPKSLLLHGPTETFEIIIAKAIAKKLEAKFYHLDTNELYWDFSKPEEHLKMVFNVARKSGPSAIFIDHIESILPIVGHVRNNFQERLINSFCNQMHELSFAHEQVMVIGSTNRIDRIDESALDMFEGKFKL